MQQKLDKEDFDYVWDARAAIRDRPSNKSTFFLFSCVAILIAGITWSYFAELEEVTRGEGRVIPSSRTQMIQSLEGGILKSLEVREGDRVKKGQIVGSISDTEFASDLGELRARELGLSARSARLRFEASGAEDESLVFNGDFAQHSSGVLESEQSLFTLRGMGLENQIKILDERLLQRQQELAELQENQKRYASNLEIGERELTLKAPLAKQGIISRTDFLRLEREISDLKGQLAATNQSLPRVEASIREAERAKEEQTLAFRQSAQAELSSTLAELAVVRQTLKAAQDKVNRADMRSPVDGIVNKIHINTVGGVVRMGEPIMEITPMEESLFVEVRIDPKDIAFVGPGQAATVKLTAYDYTIYGVLDGKVEVISSDTILDESSKTSYYLVTIRTTQGSLLKGNEVLPIIPGMVATADIITGKKSVLEYLLKPIIKARHEAMRER